MAYDRSSATQNVDWKAIDFFLAQQALFGRRTHDSQCMTLTQTKSCVELPFNAAGERKVEILASQQEVLADGSAFKLDVSALDVGTYEAEVRCAASDVANQHELAVSQVISENVLMLRHPRIEGSQRLFQ